MSRASNFSNDRVVKHEWPSTPELTLADVRVKKNQMADPLYIRVIIKAVSITGEEWEGTEPPKIQGLEVWNEEIST